MDKEQLLAQLEDVQLPPEPSWWPLAIGWWILIAIVLALGVFGLYKLIQKKRHYRFSRLALAELDYLVKSQDNSWLIQLEVLLRRVALCYFPTVDVAKLTQQEWIDFLAGTGNNIWTNQPLTWLRDASYSDPNKSVAVDRALLLSQSKAWIEAIPEVSHV